MPREYISIGAAPCEEKCASVGSPDYAARASAECERFRNLIRSNIGQEPPGAALIIKSFPHDFGSYYELCVSYDEDSAEAEAYALHCENYAPIFWNDKEKHPFFLLKPQEHEALQNPPEKWREESAPGLL